MNSVWKRITAALFAVALLVGVTGFALSQSLTSTSDVQIVAQKLEDGRIEFALEQDGERILPRTRFFPVDAEVGRWLRSSAVTVELEAPGAEPQAPDSIYRTVGSVSVEHPRLWYSVERDRFTDALTTWMTVEENGSFESWESPMVMWVSCSAESLRVYFTDAPLSDINDQYTVTYRFDNLSARSAVWSDAGAGGYSAYLPAREVADFWIDLKRSEELVVRFVGFSQTHTATFNLDGAWVTVVQPNLEQCGTYQ